MTKAQAGLPALVRSGQLITLLKHGEPVSVLVPWDRFQALLETLEILGNPDAVKAIKDFKAGRLKRGKSLRQVERELDALEDRH